MNHIDACTPDSYDESKMRLLLALLFCALVAALPPDDGVVTQGLSLFHNRKRLCLTGAETPLRNPVIGGGDGIRFVLHHFTDGTIDIAVSLLSNPLFGWLLLNHPFSQEDIKAFMEGLSTVQHGQFISTHAVPDPFSGEVYLGPITMTSGGATLKLTRALDTASKLMLLEAVLIHEIEERAIEKKQHELDSATLNFLQDFIKF